MLAQGGHIRPYATESVGTGGIPERVGDLLLDLEHPQVALGLVIVEGHGPVAQEREHRIRMGPQAVEELARLALFEPPARGASRLARGWGIGRFPAVLAHYPSVAWDR